MKTIKWKDGTRFSANAEKCYEEINSLERITPENIVEYARDEGTELHKCFQWDDAKAAESWRRQQARFIVSSLTVVIEKDIGEHKTFRLIQHDEVDREYKPIVFSVRNMDEYSRLLEQAKRELRSFRARYKQIVELADVIEEISKALEE